VENTRKAIMESEQEKLMAQYLLGQLPAQEQAKLEDKFLADDSCFEELLIVEEDLRDAYAHGELSDPDRKAFEQRLLTTHQQQQKQRFVETLVGYGGPAAPAPRRSHGEFILGSILRVLRARPILVPALSAAMLVLIAGSLWLTHRSPTPVVSSGEGSSSDKQPQVKSEEQETKTLTLFLAGDLVRSAGQELPTLVIPSEVTQVRLEARVTRDYPRYEAILQTMEGNKISSHTGLEVHHSPAGENVVIRLPRSVLPRGDYILTIRGFSSDGRADTVAEYGFRIRTR
jgi:anti-sigma-K factor RskA